MRALHCVAIFSSDAQNGAASIFSLQFHVLVAFSPAGDEVRQSHCFCDFAVVFIIPYQQKRDLRESSRLRRTSQVGTTRMFSQLSLAQKAMK